MSDWQNTKENLPEPEKLYWITDGKEIALARFKVDRMQWSFEWHCACFKPTFMMKVQLPQLPEI